jgi:hypothetical protein
MNNLTLFVGNNDHTVRDVAIKFNDAAEIIVKDNLKNLNNINIGYISLGDHSLKDFYQVLDVAKELYYVPTNSWDHKETKEQTEQLLIYFSYKKYVYNLPIVNKNYFISTPLIDTRKTTNSQIWTAGCSFTEGVGVETDQKYGYLLGKHLNKPVSCLAHRGSSIAWAADQLLRSDIQKDDIVIWGLTGISRMAFYNNGEVNHITNSTDTKQINLKYLVTDHMLYTAYTCIQQVIQHSKILGYKLILLYFPINLIEFNFRMMNWLEQFDCVLYFNLDNFIDYGTDKIHPGPKTHQFYADSILKFLKG